MIQHFFNGVYPLYDQLLLSYSIVNKCTRFGWPDQREQFGKGLLAHILYSHKNCIHFQLQAP